MEARPTICLERVTKRFHISPDGGFTAIEDMSLEVHQGEFVSVVGPTGCGKSTLLGMISGLLSPSAGRILAEGEEVTGINKKLGYLFQRDALFPWKTILDNIAVPLLFRGWNVQEARIRARAWIRRVGLVGFERYHPHQLSGGDAETGVFGNDYGLRTGHHPHGRAILRDGHPDAQSHAK